MLEQLTSGIRGPTIISLLSILILGTALGFQYIGGLNPCELCIYQRIPYRIVIIAGPISLILVLLGWRNLAALMVLGCAITFLVGACIALYHVGIEQQWWIGQLACAGGSPKTAINAEEMRKIIESSALIRCDEVVWSFLGISMAGYNFICSLLLSIFSYLTARELKRNTYEQL